MRSVPRPLLVLHVDRRFRERVRRAAGTYEYVEIGSWQTLAERMRGSPPGTVAVVDPYHADRAELAAELRLLLREFPSAAVVAALNVRPDRFRDLHVLGAWGVVEIVSIGEDDTVAAMERRLRDVQGRPLQNLLERALPPQTSGQARSLLLTAAEVVSVGGQAGELAKALFVSPRSLLRWCRRAELPPPRRVLVWMRVLLAAEMLDDPGRTVTNVAHACGYASDNSLRRALQDALHTTPTALRKVGAFAFASQAFLRELLQERAGGVVVGRGQRSA